MEAWRHTRNKRQLQNLPMPLLLADCHAPNKQDDQGGRQRAGKQREGKRGTKISATLEHRKTNTHDTPHLLVIRANIAFVLFLCRDRAICGGLLMLMLLNVLLSMVGNLGLGCRGRRHLRWPLAPPLRLQLDAPRTITNFVESRRESGTSFLHGSVPPPAALESGAHKSRSHFTRFDPPLPVTVAPPPTQARCVHVEKAHATAQEVRSRGAADNSLAALSVLFVYCVLLYRTTTDCLL